MDLAEFLLARIAEDEEVAREAAPEDNPSATRWQWAHAWDEDKAADLDDLPLPDLQLQTADRYLMYDVGTVDESGPRPRELLEEVGVRHPGVLAHIARHDPARVLADCEAKQRIVELNRAEWDGAVGEPNYCSATIDEIFRLLALPYASHADYDESWKP